jgi:hypothetical protein
MRDRAQSFTARRARLARYVQIPRLWVEKNSLCFREMPLLQDSFYLLRKLVGCHCRKRDRRTRSVSLIFRGFRKLGLWKLRLFVPRQL